MDRGGRCWTPWRWSTRKGSEVRILYAPPPSPPEFVRGAGLILTDSRAEQRCSGRLRLPSWRSESVGGEVRVLGGHLVFWEHAARLNEAAATSRSVRLAEDC